MPITPADIHHVAFGKAPIGRRGYDEDQVDALLDEISQEMAELLEEKEILRRRRDNSGPFESGEFPLPDTALRAEYSAVQAALNRARREFDRADETARHLQRELEESRRSAVAATAITAPSGEMPAIVAAMAQRTADDHLNEAHRRSEAMTAEARAESDRVVREALEKAQRLEAETERRRREAADELKAADAAARREIEELTTFAEDYYAALMESVRRQTQYLDGTA